MKIEMEAQAVIRSVSVKGGDSLIITEGEGRQLVLKIPSGKPGTNVIIATMEYLWQMLLTRVKLEEEDK